MKHFAENATAATTILLMILGGYAYVISVSFKTDANAKSIEVIEQKQGSIDRIQTDIAVIKEQVAQIKDRLEKE
jgi:hypothetical protein